MEQLLAHLIGDYILQSDWMAREKTRSLWVAVIHAAAYSLPFLLLCSPSFLAWSLIFTTHAVIDRWRIARYVVFAKNFLTHEVLDWPRWEDSKQTGYPSDRPIWLAMWLLIIADNTMHMLVNYLALRYC